MKSWIFLIFFALSDFAFSLELKAVSPFHDVKWTFETTRGWKTFSVVSKETLKVERLSPLDSQGLLFHSYFRERMTSKAQLNLAFSKIPRFLWTEEPDFVHEETLTECLKCVDFDFQAFFPRIGYRFMHLLFFAGYSFVNYAGDETYAADSFFYSNLSGGMQFFQKINRFYTHIFMVSYSPTFIIEDWMLEDTLHYVNFGAEFLLEFRYFSLTFFINSKKAFVDFRKFGFFDSTKQRYSTDEIGFSFHIRF